MAGIIQLLPAVRTGRQGVPKINKQLFHTGQEAKLWPTFTRHQPCQKRCAVTLIPDAFMPLPWERPPGAAAALRKSESMREGNTYWNRCDRMEIGVQETREIF